jgi:hypothetical protein
VTLRRVSRSEEPSFVTCSQEVHGENFGKEERIEKT